MTSSKQTKQSRSGAEFYSVIFERIETFLRHDRPIIVAIDGTAGSGKSSLANILSGKYDCQVFHMDDFFLPLEMKTNSRLNEPGGNVHYERFLTEVMEPLKEGKPIAYQRYNCRTWAYDDPIEVVPKQLNIVEGVYALHPVLQPFYDWTLFLKVEREVQLARILAREGEAKLKQFIDRWIPLEENYFTRLDIEQVADLVMDTSNL